MLDLGVGKGACLFPAAEKVGVSGRVIGVDNSQRVVDSTSSIITEQGIMNAEIRLMDLQRLEFDSERFDFIMGGFVLPFILTREQDRLSSEIFRVLKKGGRLGLSTWARIEDEEWLATYLSRHLSAGQFGGDLGNFMKITVEELEAILWNCSFQDVTGFKREAKFVYLSPQHWLKTMESDPDYKAYFDQIRADGFYRFDAFKQDAFTDLQAKEKPEGN